MDALPPEPPWSSRISVSQNPGFPKPWFPKALVSQGYGFPDKISRSLPSRPDPVRIVSFEYGSVFGLTQARQMSPEAPGNGADSCPGDPAKVKQFWRI
jgi:hypothetical protein